MSIVQRLLAAAAAIALVLFVTITTMRTESQYQKFAPASEVVGQFMKLAFDERKPQEAALKYLSPDFVDHDPAVTGTRDSVIARLNSLDWSTSVPRSDVKHIVAEGDYVVIHHFLVRKPGDRGIAAVDIFRAKNGLLVEHWDVMQPMPEQSVNAAPMF
ncbi:MAG TPA: nuclear transport factor 2 family protein [Steroidobacteraceae bacterium]|jgi:predicted SnoaL-like aldol condensation-catalyzing enzyme|nr:nuclear transport factor 2 family protein [Steroidobacteraceae bacterium]